LPKNTSAEPSSLWESTECFPVNDVTGAGQNFIRIIKYELSAGEVFCGYWKLINSEILDLLI
jgi:hypothetical protein